MKGNFNQNDLFWEIETKGEQWEQGQTISGALSVSNKGNKTVTVSNASVNLAFADFKKVFAGNSSAFNFTQKFELPSNLTLKSDQKETLLFEFKLDLNAFISDKKSSFYLTYGIEGEQKHLQLLIIPKPIFLKVVELLENFYRFKCVETKGNKKGVEFKFKAPASKELATVEGLSLIQRLEDNILCIDFTFDINKIDLLASSNSTKPTTKKESKVFSLKLNPKEYLYTKDILNQEFLLKKLEEVIAEVKVKGFFQK
ncbi:MAG: hypothetical protein U0T83_11305 [Bacteriovoracaceae bacterium]